MLNHHTSNNHWLCLARKVGKTVERQLKTNNKKNKTMKTVIAILLMSICITSQMNATDKETLNNQSIIALTKAKMSKDLIISKIQNAENSFDLSSNALCELKTNKVSDAVVQEMLYAAAELPEMNNDDVVAMCGCGASKAVITDKINLSTCNFKTDTDALIALKESKVPEGIIKLIVDPSTNVRIGKNANVISNSVADHDQKLAAPKSLPGAGIYYENFSNAPVTYEKLESTTTNQATQGSVEDFLLNRVTRGISGIGSSIGVANPNANYEIVDKRPVFYFNFPNGEKDFNEVIESVSKGVVSPNEFVLMRMEQTKKGRKAEIARANLFSTETGFSKGTVLFRFQKVSENLYKVYFDEDLPAGEYAFYYNKGSEQVSSVKLFDFSLKNNVSTK